ncbi:MAG TPA: hypothetical protein VHG51_14710 [Longimicrobiaceae bacterium]|nr:hypothetical protein [Longimicrobiaceae bacterium]
MAKKISLTPALRQEYLDLFDTCSIRPGRMAAAEKILARILSDRARYEKTSAQTGVPWAFVAVVHNMESDGRFDRHLHNGDPLTKRTVRVPPGRPKSGKPPFGWEESAADALGLKGLGAGTDWSLPGTLYRLEAYNGWGYRQFHPHVKSPYLWSFSTHYDRGKYVSDGTWSESARSQQCGAAVLLRRLAETGEVDFPDQPAPPPGAGPLVAAFSTRTPDDPAEAERARELQRWLNTYPGVFVKVDGIPGRRTSEAYRKVTGGYLPGDPRS